MTFFSAILPVCRLAVIATLFGLTGLFGDAQGATMSFDVLAQQAQRGDAQAQLELAKRYF
ncbi:hypothetical protein RZ760_015040 [Providencia rettgeri]|nr:hypothetical protein [Providencia rettgeri]